MEKQQEYLLKHFASVLRKIALGKEKEIANDTNVAHCLNRKDLIQIVKKQFGGAIPKEYNLIEMEKVELFEIIEDQLLIISYITEKMSQTGNSPVTKREVAKVVVKKPEKKEILKKKPDGK